MLRGYVITDVGSTTTKALLIGPEGKEARLLGRAAAPTTVEKPFEDVTVGVVNALRELEELAGISLVTEICRPAGEATHRQYRYLSTSSAGGGLQILVYGLTKSVTADSARRAALGGGAIILDVMATDDGRQGFVKMDAVRNCRPDMVLIAGGLDGGNVSYVLEVCDILNAAKPSPRFGSDFRIPVIYAGNKDAAETVRYPIGPLRPHRRRQLAAYPGERSPRAREESHPRALHVPRDAAGAGIRCAKLVGRRRHTAHACSCRAHHGARGRETRCEHLRDRHRRRDHRRFFGNRWHVLPFCER